MPASLAWVAAQMIGVNSEDNRCQPIMPLRGTLNPDY